ncbi:MAG: MFS transporter [Gammaproteobacteria bacterium]|jgi:MFS family permease|nr:MFS transporter [Gammaproteobacteria bacterium]|tara:strand:+ start:1087 stop:2247 length:1161 start_codon:yes stop_codon:yes gene_type:complete
MSNQNRLKNLAKVMLAITLVGVIIGINLPLSSLTLQTWGTSTSVIGFAASMTGLATVVITPFFSKLINRFGQMGIMRFCLVVLPIAIAFLPVFQNIYIWFLLRFIIGVVATGVWLLSEVWINALAEDQHRGKIIALYSSLISLGLIVGVLISSLIPIETGGGFYVSAGIAVISAIPLWKMDDLPDFDVVEDISFYKYLVTAPGLMGSSWIMGFLYAATAALLPIFALPFVEGDYAQSSRTVAWLASGELTIPLFVGWLADRYDKTKLMIYISCVSVIALAILPAIFDIAVMRFLFLFIIGGSIMSFYSLGLTLLGQEFKGKVLASANASFIFFLSLGEILGPPVVGAAMDLFGNNAFGWFMALIGLIYLIIFIGSNASGKLKIKKI